MNDEELRRRLASWCPAEESESARDRAWLRVRAAFVNAPASSPLRERRSFLAIRWAMAAALAVIAGALCVLRFPEVEKTGPLEGDRALLAEMQKLFPQDLGAVVCAGKAIGVQVSPAGSAWTSQPVALEFHFQDHIVRVLTYSGNSFVLPFLAQGSPVEVLVSGDGGVMLAGSHFVCDSQGHGMPPKIQMEARLL